MRFLITSALALCASLGAAAQSVAAFDPVKPLNYNNPISPIYLCADPTAVEYEGRLYVYGTNDQQEYESVTPGTNNGYGHIKSLVILSSADMLNWTHHGIIDMSSVCGSWMGCSWAPSICSRVEDDGLTHFYMYFSNGGGGVGVVTSTSPVGPWTDPLRRTFINGGTPGVAPCSWPFDPGVVIDDEGNGWLAMGGGDPVAGGTALQPGNARIVKLGDDMLSFGSEFKKIPAPYQLEASELNIIGGKFVYSYSTNWDGAHSDWGSYTANPTNQPAPSTCCISYMTSTDPLNPDSWVYGGDILRNPGQFGYPGGNNHCHLHKFGSKYYMVYHTQVMEHLAGIHGGYRSIAVNVAVVNEDKCTINPITANNTSAPQIKDNSPDPFERQEAEMMWNASGIKLQKTKDAGNMVIASPDPGAWVAVKNINFDQPAKSFTAYIRGRGSFEIRVGDPNAAPAAVVNFNNTAMKETTVDLDTEISGKKTIYFVFIESSASMRFDAWRFNRDAVEGICDIDATPEAVSVSYVNAQGVVSERPLPGLCIERTVYSDGSVSCEKVIR